MKPRTAARDAPPPTEAELELLGILWKLGSATVREVHEATAATRPVGYTTVLKQMQVMHRKGLVERSERHRAHIYKAAEPQERTRQRLAQGLLRRAFDGSARQLLVSALGGRRVDEAELQEIRALLDEIKEDR